MSYVFVLHKFINSWDEITLLKNWNNATCGGRHLSSNRVKYIADHGHSTSTFTSHNCSRAREVRWKTLRTTLMTLRVLSLNSSSVACSSTKLMDTAVSVCASYSFDDLIIAKFVLFFKSLCTFHTYPWSAISHFTACSKQINKLGRTIST